MKIAEFRKTSDGGGLLLREFEQRTDILQRFAKCFINYRDEKRIKHSVLSLVSQRVIGLAYGMKTSTIMITWPRIRCRPSQ